METIGGIVGEGGKHVRQSVCEKHGSYPENGMTLLSDKITWFGCRKCQDEKDKQEREKAEAKRIEDQQQRLRARIEAAAIPPRFQHKTLETYSANEEWQKRALAATTQFIEKFPEHQAKGTFLTFSGNTGTGKSHLAVASMLKLMAVTTVQYFRVADMIRVIRSTWRRDSDQTEADVIARLTNIGLLVLDEVGVQRGTDDEQNTMFDVLDNRYSHMKPTILLTNLNADEFARFVGNRLYDRMMEVGIWLPFNGESWRRK